MATSEAGVVIFLIVFVLKEKHHILVIKCAYVIDGQGPRVQAIGRVTWVTLRDEPDRAPDLHAAVSPAWGLLYDNPAQGMWAYLTFCIRTCLTASCTNVSCNKGASILSPHKKETTTSFSSLPWSPEDWLATLLMRSHCVGKPIAP